MRDHDLDTQLTSCLMTVVMRCLTTAMTLVVAPMHTLGAQMIAGAVEDSASRPIAGARVAMLGTDAAALTDSLGRFAFNGMRDGTHILQIRRLGFAATTTLATVRAADTLRLSIELTPVPLSLETVRVEAAATTHKLNRVGFVDRRLHSAEPASHFVTRSEFERYYPFKVGEIVRRMGAFAARCPSAKLVVDGAVWPAQISSARLDALDAIVQAPRRSDPYDVIAPSLIEAIEVYVSDATVPPQFSRSGCVVVIWTRE